MILIKKTSLAIFLIAVLSLAACSSDKGEDKGDGFKVSETETTKTTTPSKTPNLKQPCSLMTATEAASILNIPEGTLDPAKSTEIGDNTLRCRYGALSDDSKLFLVLNIYIYKDEKAYDQIKEVNKGEKISTEVDDGFSYTRSNQREVEYFVAAREGKTRIGVSASIALTSADGALTQDQIELPGLDVLATEVGKLLAKV